MNESAYFDQDEGIKLSSEEVRSADRETQINVMRSWFYKNFENPAERTPYESKEGGYQWIWGGPYDADEELQSEFSDLVPLDVINELAVELNKESWEWGQSKSQKIMTISSSATAPHCLTCALSTGTLMPRNRSPSPYSPFPVLK